MEEKCRQRMDTIDALAHGDDQYFSMLKAIHDLEKRFNAVLRTLTAEQQNAVCDYVSLCEEMSWRKLELACTYMSFPQ